MQDKIWTYNESDSLKLREFLFIKNITNYKSFESDKGKIIGDYQEKLELEWIKELKLKYPVLINKKGFAKDKKCIHMNKFFIIISILFVGCKMSGDEDEQNVARFNDSYLNKSDFSKLMTNYSEEDSIVRANNVINNWAINKILIERAKLNLMNLD